MKPRFKIKVWDFVNKNVLADMHEDIDEWEVQHDYLGYISIHLGNKDAGIKLSLPMEFLVGLSVAVKRHCDVVATIEQELLGKGLKRERI